MQESEIRYVLKNEGPLKLLEACGGYYACPKDAAGKRLGPLVGYAGRDASGKQYVGDIYVNFAQAETNPLVLDVLAQRLLGLCRGDPEIGPIDVFLGAPEGGKSLALFMAYHAGKLYAFPEKKVMQLATAQSREQSALVFARHGIESGASVLIVEDVLNNFSTTEQLIDLIGSAGGIVVGIAAFLNRSHGIEGHYEHRGFVPGVPIVNLVRQPIPQYSQDDPLVADDIAAGNVVWKPKNEWARLEAAMRSNRT